MQQQVMQYPVQLVPAEEGGFTVLFPGLPIVTEGDTKEEALKNAEEAFLCHLEGCAKDMESKSQSYLMMMQIDLPDRLSA